MAGHESAIVQVQAIAPIENGSSRSVGKHHLLPLVQQHHTDGKIVKCDAQGLQALAIEIQSHHEHEGTRQMRKKLPHDVSLVGVKGRGIRFAIHREVDERLARQICRQHSAAYSADSDAAEKLPVEQR